MVRVTPQRTMRGRAPCCGSPPFGAPSIVVESSICLEPLSARRIRHRSSVSAVQFSICSLKNEVRIRFHFPGEIFNRTREIAMFKVNPNSSMTKSRRKGLSKRVSFLVQRFRRNSLLNGNQAATGIQRRSRTAINIRTAHHTKSKRRNEPSLFPFVIQ